MEKTIADPVSLFTGRVKSFCSEKGYGFITCDAAFAVYKRDVFLHKAEFEAAGCPGTGSQVQFRLTLNNKQQPQCQDLVLDRSVAEEKTRNLRKQVEWYFSDASLCADEFFYKKASENEEGWVSLRWLLRCRKIMELGVNNEAIFAALAGSHLQTKRFCKCSPCNTVNDHIYVRRRQPLPPFVGKQHRTSDGTISLEGCAANALDLFKTMNRLEDQKRVQNSLGLKEIGNETTYFREVIKLPTGELRAGLVLACGYERVVYGDAGPYVEFNSMQIVWPSWPHMNDKSHLGDCRFYDEFFTEQSHRQWESSPSSRHSGSGCAPSLPALQLYAQTQDVVRRPYAPNTWSVGRASGYADYRAGYFYLAADAALIAVEGTLPDILQAKFLSLEMSQEATQSEYDLCWQWQSGKCWKGEYCQWRHG
eukprot:TRINITY_DN32762_c0_g1_i1.p1 TRINITY_DN32762_c0_g1~~TRINITY_DN32762_c0_g1_i1.p1  ORF type:complete len:421 (+),score=70.27 TRINITY_DN32762_c0_g1_i1:13-1275(+)